MGFEKLDTEVRQEQIAQAALSLVATRGMQGLKVAEVARRIGLVPSAIYRHFKSKRELLDTVLVLIEGRLMGNVELVRAETPEPLERLRRLLARHVQLIREYQALPRILFSEELTGGDAERKARLHGIVTGYLAEVAALVREGQRAECIRPELDPATVALLFIGLFQPSVFLWHLSDGKFDVTKHAEKAWLIFQDAIRKEPMA